MLDNIKKIYRYGQEQKYFSKLLKDIREENIVNKTIVLNTIRNYPRVLQQELFLAYILAKLGAKVFVVLDNGVLKHWDTYQLHDGKKIKELTPYRKKTFKNYIKNNIIFKNIKNLYNHPNIKLLTYTDIVDLNNLIIQNEYVENEIKISLHEFAKSSTKRYFETSELLKDNAAMNEYFEYSLYNANISIQIGRYIKEKVNPDVFMTSHGIYSVWGPAYEYLRKSGFRTLIYGQHAHMPHRILIADERIQVLSTSREWNNVKDIVVDEVIKNNIKKYFKSRINHQSIDTKIYYKDVEILKDLYIDSKFTYCAFPNVIWDGDINDRNVAFKGVVDWLTSTIEFFIKNNDLTLIIRFHPAEATLFRGVKSVEQIIREKFRNLDEFKNIILISSGSKVDSYELASKYVDVALVYDGILGIELPYMDIPVIMGAKGHFAIEGINRCIRTREEYYDLLNNPESIINHHKFNFNLDIFYRFSSWYLYEVAYLLPVLDKNHYGEINLDEITKADIDIYNNKAFLDTIERIVGEKINVQ